MSAILSVDTKHDDMIHDAQIDYYSRKLATASSDCTVKVWDVFGDSYSLATTLSGHQGPVWQVAWAHPKFGVLLASCSYDGKVVIHREAPAGVWTPIHEQVASCSVNSLCWAPHEHGLVLGCAFADGTIAILKHMDDDSWSTDKVLDSSRLGCNAISFAPVTSSSSSSPGGGPVPLKFATASCDNTVKVWEQNPGDGSWAQSAAPLPPSHEDWVRDVAWAPNTSTSASLIASCSEDRTVSIWTCREPGAPWEVAKLTEQPFEAPVWRVSWSVTGNLLAVSCGDHKVTLWKQSLSGKWENVSHVTDAGVAANGM